MKRLIIAVLIAMLLIPAIVSAQEIPTPQPSWIVKPERSILFVGEDLIVMVNGTGNTSYTLEMRPLDANNTIMNATFTYRGLTDANGTEWAVVPDGYNEEPGSYRVQVLVNQIVMAYADVRLDYSFERWVEIQFRKADERDARERPPGRTAESRQAGGLLSPAEPLRGGEAGVKRPMDRQIRPMDRQIRPTDGQIRPMGPGAVDRALTPASARPPCLDAGRSET